MSLKTTACSLADFVQPFGDVYCTSPSCSVCATTACEMNKEASKPTKTLNLIFPVFMSFSCQHKSSAKRDVERVSRAVNAVLGGVVDLHAIFARDGQPPRPFAS